VARLVDGGARPAPTGAPHENATTDSPAKKPADFAPATRSRRLAVGALVAALGLLVAGGGWWWRARLVAPPAAKLAPVAELDAKSVAVLPFTVVGGAGPEGAAFADGMHDDVLASLAKVRDLRVISRRSVIAFRDPAKRDLGRIAADLGVAFVLEASIRRERNTVRVSAQLTDVRNGATRWADSYDRETGDNFALQAELAQKIAAALDANLTTRERRDLDERPTRDLAAYELFQRARTRYHELGITGSREDYDDVAAQLEQAVARDRDFLLAQVHLVLVHGWNYYSWVSDPSPTRLARARAALAEAERIGRDRPETAFARGVMAYYTHDWATALREFRSAEPGLPNDSDVAKWLALSARRLGDWRNAVRSFEHSLRLNPLELAALQATAETLLFLRRYQDALALTERAQRLFPPDRQLGMMEAKARYELDGDRAAFLQRWGALPPTPTDPEGRAVRYDLAELAGDFAEAERVLRGADATVSITMFGPASREPTPLHRAYTAFFRGDAAAARTSAEEALAALRTAPASWRTENQRAEAEVLAGRPDAAVARLEALRTRLRGTDAVTELWVHYHLAYICALADRREEAIATLRQVASAPSAFPRYLTWRELPRHPVWRRLADDPRLEEIVRSVRAL
jgi:TolB-like protein